MVKIALDAMGGDNAPAEIVKGAVQAVAADKDCFVYLVGKEEKIKECLNGQQYDSSRIEIVNADDVIETGEPPVMAIRRKKESSLVKAMYMVKNKEADAFVSAGSSGAILVGGQTIVGRLRGVDRPPMAALIPTKDGVSLLVDSGANVDARATMLVQWAVMGSIYMENVVGVKNPRVAIVNVGLEEEKGNALVKETYPMLKECPNINFIGSIEAREIPNSYADIIVCDAFVGNCILKLYEGEAKMILGKIKGVMMSSLKTKIGAVLIKKSLKTQLKSMDASEHGGAPLIGLNGLVVKTHGNAKAKEVKNSLIQCVTFTKMNINDKIIEALGQILERIGIMEFEKLQNIIADVLNIDKEKITPETTFVDDLGADSLDVFQIIMGIEDEFDIQIPDDAAESIVTVNDAVVQIQNATK